MADAASRIFNVMKRSGTDTVSELVHLKVKTVNPLTLILDDRVTLTEDFFELSKSINVANIHVDDILVGISLNGGQKYLIQENSNDETSGLPPGGFAGEVLSKESNDDFDVKWKNMSELSKVGDTLPIGSIIPYGSFTVPDNWLLCDGRAVSRTEYSFLYAAIGTLFGSGDGSTTFNLPDLQGRVPAGWKGSDADFGYMGGAGGSKTHTLTIEQMPKHRHSLDTIGKTLNWEAPNLAMNYQYTSSELITQTQSMGYSGSSQPHNNLQPYLTVGYIIKAKQSTGLVANVIDSLNSDSSANALSAKQGKVLNTKLDESSIAVYNGGLIDPNTTLENLILTRHSNNPASDNQTYYYITTLFYSKKAVDANRIQIAVGYKENDLYQRFYFDGSWSDWQKKTTVAHQVWGVNLTPGNTLTDSRIYLYGGAKQVILYYTANDNNYINSVVISRQQNDWSMVFGFTGSVIVGYFMVNFASGIITSSQYTNASIRCVGYDIIK